MKRPKQFKSSKRLQTGSNAWKGGERRSLWVSWCFSQLHQRKGQKVHCFKGHLYSVKFVGMTHSKQKSPKNNNELIAHFVMRQGLKC